MADGSATLFPPANDEPEPIDVVYFAGAGGSSEAYRIALGKHPDVALNHNPIAIGVHMLNCPETEHFVADVFDIDPRVIRPGVKWRSFWASPDCRHFSKAKGSAPVSPRVRGLAWVVVKVAKMLGDNAPDVIFLENVEEFVDWGPLLPPDDKGVQRPDPARRGETFGLWCKRLRQCGYVVEYKVDWIASDFGAPTTRKRLMLIARRDGKPIVWPAPTHAPRKVAKAKGLKPAVPASECIDFSIPCPSIFLTQEECRERGIRAKRPLEEATMARIAKGIYRYVIASGDPFIVPIQNWSHERVHPIDEPLRTITAWPKGGAFAVVQPSFVVRTDNSGSTRAGVHDVEDPLRTVTSAGGFALVQPQLAGGAIVGCGSRAGQSPPRGLDEPLGTIIGKADRCLVSAFMSGVAYGDDRPRAGLRAWPMDEAVRTVTATPDKAIVSACLVPSYGEREGQEPRCRGVDDPYPTVVPTGNGGRLVTAFMEQANTGMVGRDAREPLSTIVQRGTTQRLVAAEVGPTGVDVSDRLSAFLVKYYGSEVGQDLRDPLHCVTTRARFGLVYVRGELMQITDIGMRMLEPKELAAAQGFPKTYVTGKRIDFGSGEVVHVTKTDETRLIGNSVSPIAAAPFIKANLDPDLVVQREVA